MWAVRPQIRMGNHFSNLIMKIELSQDQVSLVLYCLEGYVAGLDDSPDVANEDHVRLINEIDPIFEILENVGYDPSQDAASYT